MKKILTKYWGVVLVIVLLSTLFIGAAPVANAGTLNWSLQTTPDTLGFTNQVVPAATAGLDVANLTVASDGTLFCIDTFPATDVVYKSVDGGITWTASVPVVAGLVDLAVSPSYATDHTVFVLKGAAAAQVYISTNGGISFAVLGGPLAGATGTSIAVSPTYNAGSGEVMVGSTTLGVFIWGRAGVLNWDAATSAFTDGFVAKVAYSPNFAIDATRLAVTTNNTAAGTVLNTLIASDAAWNFTLPLASVAATVNSTTLASATIAFPSDFNASSPFSRTCYVGTVGTFATDNVWRVIAGFGAAVALSPLTNIGGTDHQATSLAYSGTSAAGTLFFGSDGNTFGTPFVLSTATPTGTAAVVSTSWIGSFAAPTGATNAFVALATDYATSRKVYAGTTGANSALSISTDGGFYFYQAGLIDMPITAIGDFQAANATTFYMSTNGTGTLSVWKTADSGAKWYRYLTVAAGAGVTGGILRVSPSYATDSTVVFAKVGSAAASNVYVTNNAGTSWTAKSAPVTVSDIAVKDQFTYYVANGAADNVQATANGGWTWQPVATTVSAGGTAITSIKLNSATGALLAGDNVGGVFVSLNSNATWIPLGLGIGGTRTYVAFDANYATNGFTYAASALGGTADVKRFGTGYAAWLAVGSALPIANAGGLLSAPDGTLYVSNNITAGTGIYRSINPTAGFPTLTLAGWNTVGTFLPATSTLGSMTYAAGSNVIYAIDTTNRLIYSYGDTLSPSTATSIPTPVSPANGAVFPAAAIAVLTWNAVAGATSYQFMYDTRADFATAVIGAAVAFPLTSGVTAALLPGFTYYWMVRVLTPVVGPWSAQMNFQTQLAPAAPNAPPVVAGAVGTTGPGGSAVALTPTFNWGSVPGATAYEFQLASDAAFTSILVDATGAKALPAVTAYKLATPLKYSTVYFWKVRAISATSQTAWSGVMAFTTLDMPAVAAPPVIITQMPAPTINIPAAPPATQIVIPAQPPAKEISPTYIWAIIIIGAVLVLAVIVLIVRTRRTV